MRVQAPVSWRIGATGGDPSGDVSTEGLAGLAGAAGAGQASCQQVAQQRVWSCKGQSPGQQMWQ